MKLLVLVLVLLAAAKVGTQAYLEATAKNEIIVQAYLERGIGACDLVARQKRVDVAPAWAKSGEVRLVIGKSSLDVHLWQVDHALWQARYKNPYLFFTMRNEPHRVFCEFDIVQGAANVFRL